MSSSRLWSDCTQTSLEYRLCCAPSPRAYFTTDSVTQLWRHSNKMIVICVLCVCVALLQQTTSYTVTTPRFARFAMPDKKRGIEHDDVNHRTHVLVKTRLRRPHGSHYLWRSAFGERNSRWMAVAVRRIETERAGVAFLDQIPVKFNRLLSTFDTCDLLSIV